MTRNQYDLCRTVVTIKVFFVLFLYVLIYYGKEFDYVVETAILDNHINHTE